MAKARKWTPNRVRSEDDRGSGAAGYVTLKMDKRFTGYALFEGDPSKDEPGYYEFMDHWYEAGGRSIPCAGDDCPLCEQGDKPRARAKTLWLVTLDENGDKLDPPELKTFNFNGNLLKQFTDFRGEGEKIKGRKFTISLLDKRGNYGILPKTDTMKAAEVKETLKSKDVPDYDEMITGYLNKAMQGLAVAAALDDEDDDEPEEKEEKKASKSKDKDAKGKKGKKSEPEPEEEEDDPDDDTEWPESLDEVEVTVKKVDKSGDFITVEHETYEGTKDIYTTDGIEFDFSTLSKGDTLTISTDDMDGDGDYILSGEPETDAEPEEDDPDEASDENDLPDMIEDEPFEVVSVDEGDETLEVKSEALELEFTLYFSANAKVDFDEYPAGTNIVLTAEKDSDGDMISTVAPEIVKAKAAKGGKKKGEKTKGGKKKK